MKKLLLISNPSVLGKNLENILKQNYHTDFISTVPKQIGSIPFNSYNALLLDFTLLTAVIEGTATSFTPLEFKLLKLLSLNPNTVLTRQHLLYSLWDRNGNYVEETSLNSMICRIRQRIDTENHHYIKTIYGIGYMWSTY